MCVHHLLKWAAYQCEQAVAQFENREMLGKEMLVDWGLALLL